MLFSPENKQCYKNAFSVTLLVVNATLAFCVISLTYQKAKSIVR